LRTSEASAATSEERALPAPDKLSIVVATGRFETAHYALALAASQLALGRKATLFYTLAACRALLPPEDGWMRLPADGGRDGAARDAEYRARGVGGYEELFSASVELGARLIVCEMGLKAEGLSEIALRRDATIEIAGIVTLLEDATARGQILYL
jgi:peroxiredoxin family protein